MAPGHPEPEIETLGKRIGARLLIGIAVVAPAIIVIAVTLYAYSIIDTLFTPLTSVVLQQFNGTVPRVLANLFFLLITIVLLYLLGAFVATRIGSWFHKHFDKLFERLHPLYRMVRDSVKLLIDSLGTEGLVSRVVLVESDLAKGGFLFGLLAADCEDTYLTSDDPSEKVLVFLMHGPIGNTGFMTAVPISSLHEPAEELSIADFMTKYNLRLGVGLRERLGLIRQVWKR